MPLPEPTTPRTGRAEVLLGYLDHFRGVVLDRLAAIDDDEARRSRVPSGWTPLELAHHLTHVERRWLEWGFEGTPVDDPWADHDETDAGLRWRVPTGVTAAEVATVLRERGETSRAIVARHDLAELGAPGERWDGAPPATLERVLLHLVQEYARHAGHLDVVVELAGGPTGE